MKLKYELNPEEQVITLIPEDDAERKIVEAMRLGETFTCHTNDARELLFTSTGKAAWR